MPFDDLNPHRKTAVRELAERSLGEDRADTDKLVAECNRIANDPVASEHAVAERANSIMRK